MPSCPAGARRCASGWGATSNQPLGSNGLNIILAASIDAEVVGEIGIHAGFEKTNDFRREFDEWHAACLIMFSIVLSLKCKRLATSDVGS